MVLRCVGLIDAKGTDVAQPITVGINPRLSDPRGPGTSKLDWRYLEHNKIDRNELQIRTNSQKGTGTKIAEKLNNFEKFDRKKIKFTHVLNPVTFWYMGTYGSQYDCSLGMERNRS